MKQISRILPALLLAFAAPSPIPAEEIFSDDFESGDFCAWSDHVPPVTAIEVCDSIDNDCNGVVDDECTYCQPDQPDVVCGSGHHCTAEENGDSVCRSPVGPGTQGSSCIALGECAEPYACVFDGFEFSCARWCEVAGPPCPSLGTCISFSPPRFVGATEWGVCL